MVVTEIYTEEREIAKMKEGISQAIKHDLRSVNQEEHKFWKDLLHACLEPDLDAFGYEKSFKGEPLNKISTPVWS